MAHTKGPSASPSSSHVEADIVDLTTKLTKTMASGAEGKPVTVWQFRFTPQERGDYVFLLTTAPIFLKEEEHFVQDLQQMPHLPKMNGYLRSPLILGETQR